MVSSSVMWFRRDLRLGDNPALLAAAAEADRVLPLFVRDDALWHPAGAPRRAYLVRSLRALDEATGGHLVVRHGDPVDEVLAAARGVGATSVHIAADFGPYGRSRDERVERALAGHGITLVRTGSPYAVAPGRVRRPGDAPYRMYTPFYRAWVEHGWRRPAETPGRIRWADGVHSHGLPGVPALAGTAIPAAGERAALAQWRHFCEYGLTRYDSERDRPDLNTTSRMSVHLKYGEVHPRTLLADLGRGRAAEAYRKELAWREFYADVLYHQPRSAREYLKPEMARMGHAAGQRADQLFAAWADGRTGYPFVDAGMRQLRAEGWVHNRVRMVVASFLVKDLHIEWTRGARYFLQHLVDGDLASNNHGWQWVAGTGTDAAPYFRVFNPVTQGRRFDPDGAYVRRYVPELREVPGGAVHEPWDLPDGVPAGYPDRLVDHGAERRVALDRYESIRS